MKYHEDHQKHFKKNRSLKTLHFHITVKRTPKTRGFDNDFQDSQKRLITTSRLKGMERQTHFILKERIAKNT